MATEVRLRRGTTAQNNAFTGALGEVTFDSDLKELRAHDGVTPGGFNIGKKDLPVFDTVTAASTARIPPGISGVVLNGRGVAGDGGGATYRRIGSEPGHAGKFQDASGNWWEISALQFTPQMFGAVGDGVVDDAPALNLLFDGGNKTIYVTEGNYVVGSYVRVWENTHVICHPKARFIFTGSQGFMNGIVGDTTFSTGYSGPGNIRFTGGTYGVPLPRTGSQTGCMAFAHGENILVENAVFDGLWRGHFIEFNACRHVQVRNSIFKNQQWAEGDTGRDAINIDYSWATGFPGFGTWDGTVCDDVLIEGNTFDGVQTGASSHASTPPATRQKNIRIVNNVYKNIGQHAAWCRYWDDVVISGNIVLGCDSIAFSLDNCSNAKVVNNVCRGVSRTTANHGIMLQECTDCLVLGNTVDNDGYTTLMTFALRSFGGNRNKIVSDGAKAGSSGVVNVTENTTLVDGFFVNTNMPDASVWNIPVPHGRDQGMVKVTTDTSSPSSLRGEWWYRVGSAAMVIGWKAAGSTSKEATTVLTGTTNPTFMTIGSGLAGNIQIENNIGAARTVRVKFDDS
jgi:hypothetical protein